MEENIKEDIKVLNELLKSNKLHRTYSNALKEIIDEANRNICTYKQTEIDYNSWECSKCKCDWCMEEGTPQDNNLNYCPECGARIVNFIEYQEEE